jgi:protein O-GlcNAc transferase
MSAPPPSPPLEVQTSRHFLGWLHDTGASLAFTTYQTNRLFLLGLKPDGRLSIFERLFDRPMGLCASPDRLWMSTRWQMWQLDDALPPGETHQGYDRLYVPRRAATTGDLDVHDIAIDGAGRVVFVNTAYSCLATLSDRYSFAPLWQPPFVTRLAPEDRCHLNGLAMEGGRPRFVTAVSRSDVAGGWRERRHTGGCLVDVASGEIALGDLSMPHSPRVHGGRAWLLNSGTGELGFADLAAGRFEPVAFCPGFLRGLAIVGDYALVGLSKPRHERTFSGLALDDRLREKDSEARCGIWVVDLRSGVVAHWVELAGVVVELYDVQILPGVKRPMALGFKSDEIQRLVTIDVAPRPIFQPLVAAKPADAAPPAPARDPRRAEDAYRTANRLVQAKRFEEALAEYEEAVALDPQHEKALLNLGALLAQLGRDDDALAATARAAQIAPASPRAQSNLASLLQKRGDLAGALRALEAARSAVPDDAKLANQHGLVLYEDGRLAAARDAFERAIALAPDSAEAYNNLAGVLKVEDRLAEALPLHEKAAALRPDFVEALENVGKIQEDRCDVPAARLAYQRALAVRPNPVLALHRDLLCAPVVPTTQALAAYRARAEEAIDALAGTDLRIPLDRLQSSRAEPPVEWAYHGASNLTLKTKHAALFDAYLPSPPLERTPPKDGPWRVAFVVTPGHEGVFARCMSGILGAIDLARFSVAVACSRARAGAIAEAVRRPGIKWIHLPLRFDHAVERLRRAALDVIYYWEVGTDSTNHFLPFLRLAPVQCTGWGWPDTSGAPELDYHVTSEALAPRGCEAQYTERVVRLPDLPPCFARPPIPERPHGPGHFGIPEDKTRYVCAQSLRKLHPDFDALLGGVLRGDPNGVAVLVEDTHPAPGELLRARWRQTLPDVVDRIVLVPRLAGEDYFHLIAGAGVFLDPLHFGGANTAYDAIAAGVPIVTLPGVFPRGRYAAALSKAVGVEDGIALNPVDYVTRALALGTDPVRRAEASARIRAGSAHVFGSPTASRQLERFFEQAIAGARDGVTPQFSFP